MNLSEKNIPDRRHSLCEIHKMNLEFKVEVPLVINIWNCQHKLYLKSKDGVRLRSKMEKRSPRTAMGFSSVKGAGRREQQEWQLR